MKNSSPSDVLIHIQGITKVYKMGDDTVHALRGVDLEVKRGEMLAIMGSSGSGKSTMLNILGTLDQPSAGSYRLDGQEVATMEDRDLSQYRNRKIGFVFQQFNLLSRHTALANVELPMMYGGVAKAERRARAEQSLKRVGLGARMHHKPTELSGGQQQRVSIARALVLDPPLLLADEPTGALDTETTYQIMDLFCELHEAGITVVLVTHEPEVAAYASRIVRFKDGRIIEDVQNKNRTKRGHRPDA